MTGLLVKDLYIMRQNLKSLLFVLVVWSLIFLGGDRSAMFLIPMFTMIAGVNVLSVFSYDRQTKWETYALTLPIPRWKMVLEKYLYTLLMSAAAGLMAMGAVFLAQVLKSKAIGADFVLELLANWLTGIVIAFFYNSFSIPLTYWVGVEKARMIPSVLLGVFVFLFVILAKSYGTEFAVSDHAVTLFIVIGALFTAVMMILSYFISVSVYKKKEF